MREHDFPNKELAHQILPNIDPELMQNTLEKELKFNPNYYRIYTPEEIMEAEQM